jgi:hypothetical protein
MESITFFWWNPPCFESFDHEENNNNLSQLLRINSEIAMVTEVNHNQMNKGNKIETLNELHQTNLKEILLDLLSALPETQEVASIVSKKKKKIDLPFGRDVSLLIFILISISTNIHNLAMIFRSHPIL